MIKKFALAALAALSLTACAGLSSVPTSPGAAASQSVLDERGALGVELAYKAFRIALETAVDAGLITGERATIAATLDNRAFAAVGAVRAAYRAGNAASYAAAVDEARAAIASALGAVK